MSNNRLKHTHLPEEVATTLDGYVKAMNAIEAEFNEALASGDCSTANYCKEDTEYIKHLYRTLRCEHDLLYSKKLRYRESVEDAIYRDDLADVVNIVRVLGVSQKELCKIANISYCNLSSHLSCNRRMGAKTKNKLYIAVGEVLHG